LPNPNNHTWNNQYKQTETYTDEGKYTFSYLAFNNLSKSWNEE